MTIILNETADPTTGRLVCRARDLASAIPTLGRVRAVLRSPAASIARCVDLAGLSVGTSTAELLDDGAHLRIDFRAWTSARVDHGRTPGCSARVVRFEHDDGLTSLELGVPTGGWPALDELVDGVRARGGRRPVRRVRRRHEPADRPNDDVDVAALRRAWDDLQPSTSFSAMLARFGINRLQAYRLAGRKRAEPVPPESVVSIVARAEQAERPIAIRVHATDTSLAHIGPVGSGGLDGSSLVVRGECTAAAIALDRIVEGWCLMRPGLDEPAIALEFFDGDGRRLVSVALPNDRHVDYI